MINVKHVRDFLKNVSDVRVLLSYYDQGLTNVKKTGRPSQRQTVLSRSAIVLLVSSWEYFIEDVANTAFDYLLSKTISPLDFSKDVRLLSTEVIKNSKDPNRVWDLAGEGWKKVLVDHKNVAITKFDNPNGVNINNLFHSLLGFENVTNCWSWSGTNPEIAGKKLNQILKIRGDIAHKSRTTERLSDKVVLEYLDFFAKLAVKTSNRVMVLLKRKTGEWPWGGVKYKEKYI